MNNRLLFFGCSFTHTENSRTGVEFENYRFKLSNSIGLNHISNAFNGKSNQHIINDVYDCSNSELNDDIFVIQYSFFDRLGMRADIMENKFVSMCKTDIGNSNDWREIRQIDFYNDWLKYFYSKEGVISDFEKDVNLISNWLNNRGIKFVSIGFDANMDKFKPEFYQNNNFVKFDETYSMYKKASNHKFRICDLNFTNGIHDNHLNEEGHQYLSNKIIYKLKELDYIK